MPKRPRPTTRRGRSIRSCNGRRAIGSTSRCSVATGKTSPPTARGLPLREDTPLKKIRSGAASATRTIESGLRNYRRPARSRRGPCDGRSVRTPRPDAPFPGEMPSRHCVRNTTGTWLISRIRAKTGQQADGKRSRPTVDNRTESQRIVLIPNRLSSPTFRLAGVIHSAVPFMQHPARIQHLRLWEGGVLDCLTVPVG
jgi:hypothetical protein